MEERPILKAVNLTYATPTGKRILAENLSFELRPGQILLVTGPNGSGKSTLLRVISGALKPLRGELRQDLQGGRLGVLPQLANTTFHLPMTLGDVLSISAPKATTLDRIKEIGLLDKEHLNLVWNTASGGERKRTMLTRTLIQDPSLLLLDEPTNHLDRRSRDRVVRAIADYLSDQRRHPKALVLVSHDPMLATDLKGFGIIPLALAGGPDNVELDEVVSPEERNE